MAVILGVVAAIHRQSLSWSGLSRPPIHQLAQEFEDGWILGTLGTSPSASKPEDDRLAAEFRFEQDRNDAKGLDIPGDFKWWSRAGSNR